MKIQLAGDSKNHEELFDFFNYDDTKEIPNYLSFLQPNTINDFKSIFFEGEKFSADKNIPLDELKEMWGRILVDAIYFLRINDHRETPFFDYSGGHKAKTKMSTKGVNGAAESSVYGIKELSKYFEQFTEFESTLYGVDKYYRDHVTHPLNVWLTGVNILSKYGSQFSIASSTSIKVHDFPHAQFKWFVDEKTKEDLKSSEFLNLSTAELSAMWAIIALTHDIGYPLEKVDKINDQLEDMLSQFGNIGFSRSHFSFENQHDHLVKFLLKLISSVCNPNGNGEGTQHKEWTNHLRTKYYTKFSKSWEQFDHGIVSCLLLLKTLTFFIESDYSNEGNKPLNFEDARQFAIRSEILHAIASHTTPKIYHLAINNLAFLLVFCDDMQEWARPTLTDIRAGLKGNAESVTIVNFDITNDTDKVNEIECLIKYKDQELEDQERFVKRTFQQWLERLRPALDDSKRSFKYTWRVKFGDWPEWSFTLDNQIKDVFSKISLQRVEKKERQVP